jgi:hypothetical protein
MCWKWLKKRLQGAYRRSNVDFSLKRSSAKGRKKGSTNTYNHPPMFG